MTTLDKIILEIDNNPKIRRYKELEQIINSNQEVKRILDESKTIQKEIVHAESLNKPEQLKVLNDKYDTKMKNLKEHPLLMEYLDLQQEINNFLQDMSNSINNSLMLDLGDKAEK